MLRVHGLGKSQHLVGHCDFEVHARLQHLFQQTNITLLDMTAVFAQMQGNTVSPGLFRQQGGVQRLRITGPARLTQRGHMIDINT